MQICGTLKQLQSGRHSTVRIPVCLNQGVLQHMNRGHDKRNKVTVRPAKTQVNLGICPV